MDRLNCALRQELLDMQSRDQEVRQAMARKYEAHQALEPADCDWALAVDHANTARMKEIVARHGWPGKALVGEDGALAAWLLFQHADEDLDFQKSCVGLMTEAADNGDVARSELAYLVDRIMVHEGQPQRYGTQVQFVPNGLLSIEIEDEDRVDERRAEVGLGPLAEYIASVQKFRESR